MLTLLLISLAAHAGKWDGAESDVIVERTVSAPPEAVYGPLTNVQVLAQLFPSDCVTDWAHGSPTAGVGALSRVTYRMGSMKRRLTLTVSKAEPNRLVELDHEGKKGFVTQFRIEPADGGSKVTLGTWIQPPPAPFKGVYFNNVRPAWEDCWTRTLDNLEAMATTSSTSVGAP